VARSGDSSDASETFSEIQDWRIARLVSFKRTFVPLLEEID